jgi:hypothetical protein
MIDSVEINRKVASLDARNLSLLRNQIENLVVPLSCIVDYFGVKFECFSIPPISLNSLVYGSDTEGLVFANQDEGAHQMAVKIGLLLNLKPHFIREQTTSKLKQIVLPYDVQLHRNSDAQDPSIYILNAHRLFASEESLRSLLSPPSDVELLGRQLRPE